MIYNFMFQELLARFHQKYRTTKFPKQEPEMPARFVGRPSISSVLCDQNCALCRNVCPTNAITQEAGRTKIDLGRCLFCKKCSAACPSQQITFTKDYRLATARRENLVVDDALERKVDVFDKKIKKLFGRSLKLRQVSVGGCNACEADVNVLNTLTYDLARFGIQFVASPRHADGLLITGPVTENMKTALIKTYEAVASPKLVIVVGACAISGGLFVESPACQGGVSCFPVDLFVPGCPPHPYTILDGLLRLINR